MKPVDSGRLLVPSSLRRVLPLALMAAGIAAFVLWRASPASAATFTVNSANDVDDGTCDLLHCSLREAINAANAAAGADTIGFAILGVGVQTIAPTSALPTITDPVTIDGYTQPGASENTLATGSDAVLLIQLDGSGSGSGTNGLTITGGGSTVRGLVINGFSKHGLELMTAGSNTVEGNFIGTNSAGTAADGNSGAGVFVNGVSGNTIGGTSPAARNLISGNNLNQSIGFAGIDITGTGNFVQGNYLGTNAAGNAAIPNARGGVIVRNNGNTIGGTASGAGNLVSGNTEHGIDLFGASNSVVQGNLVGTNAAGTAGLGNGRDGVRLVVGSNDQIGGTTPGVANVISANGWAGVHIFSGGTNTVQGNLIGTNAAGTADLGNGERGVFIEGSPNNTIGGTAAGARNTISGNNTHGVEIQGAAATGNTLLGNFIGTNSTGTAALGNTGAGVFVNGASNNTVGGTTPAARNVISGNNLNTSIGFGGVDIAGPDNFVQGNYLGTDVTGTAAIPNLRDGVFVRFESGNMVGGSAAGAGNLVSGNSEYGINIFAASNNTVQGNLVGTDAAGTADLGNGRDGVRVLIGTNNTIGGTTAGAANVISGNGWAGVHLFGGSTDLTTVQGNLIGTNAAGTADLGNSIDGVFIDASPNNTIGGTGAGAGNVISGNNSNGVSVQGASGNTIQGNFIGTDVTGTADLGNTVDGVRLAGVANTLIGGTESGGRNVISGNNSNGVYVEGCCGTNTIHGNYIGTNAAGTGDLGNSSYGVLILPAASGSSVNVGGAAAGAGNVISGNNLIGVQISGGGGPGNTIRGNYIGTNAAGTGDLGNSSDGIQIWNAPSNTIGGTAAGARNVISGNNNQGILISGAAATGNIVQGNYIGTDAAGTADLGNTNDGITIDVTSNTTIGGTDAGAGNVISGNNTNGVRIVLSNGTTVQGNRIGTNAAGTALLGNSQFGVYIDRAPSNTIGGTTAGAGNVISGNNNIGVLIEGLVADGNTVQGNYIGTDAAGTANLGNGAHGVFINGSSDNTIGGTAAGAGNVISGNNAYGVAISGGFNNAVQGNLIGTDAIGSSALANANSGVFILAHNTTIGGAQAGAGNTIAFNGGPGVTVGLGGGNVIRGNSIHSNGGLGIDLAGDGVTANDPGDGDTGPNELQNFPELVSASGAGTSVLVEGTLNSTPNTDFELDFYKNDECDPSLHGEGQTFLGSTTVTTDGSGNVSFSETVPGSLPAGKFVTGTATDPNGNTSELSLCTPPPPLVVTNANDSGAGSLRAAIQAANSTPGTNTIEFDIPGGDLTIDLASALPTVTQPVVIDGTTQPGYSGSPIVELNGAGAGATADGLRITAGGSTVRGLVVNRFGGDGIELLTGGGNTIRGNRIGTNVAGTTDLGNGSDGVRINGSAGNFIGGTGSGAANVISGNNSRGVAILGAGSTGNTIRGNKIGTNAAGTSGIANGVHGIGISLGASDNTIGGQGPNTIAFNGDDGVWVGAGTGNSIQRNAIHSNGGLGIDLGADGVTPNDTGDEDTGANELQNFPVLDAALSGSTSVLGSLDSAAETDYRLYFYHSPSCDPSGNGEGQTYLGSKVVTTDEDGLATFKATFNATVAVGRQITATAEDPQGNTSELSGCREVTLKPSLSIDDVTVDEGDAGTTAATFTVTRSGATGGSSTVNYATANGTAVAPGDYEATSGTLTFDPGDTSETIEVLVKGDTVDEANETFKVNLSGATDATISDSQGVGTINDDDPSPQISIDDVSMLEPDSGVVIMTFTVTLSNPSAQRVTVAYSTANGTAVVPSDYASASGTVSFGPGATTKTIKIGIKGDTTVEPDETFFVNLSGPTNATIADNQGQGTIQNDD
jgi:CSLREA domain-containing protein